MITTCKEYILTKAQADAVENYLTEYGSISFKRSYNTIRVFDELDASAIANKFKDLTGYLIKGVAV